MNPTYNQPTFTGGYVAPNRNVMPPNQIQTTPLIWVQNQEMATNWPVTPGSSVFMMDMQELVLYFKAVDSSGKVNCLEVYDLKKREPNPNDAFVTRGELDALFKKYFGNKKRDKFSKRREDESEVEE